MRRIIRQQGDDIRIAAEKFHRHIDIREVMLVGEINRFLGMHKVVSVGGILGPTVDGADVLQGMPVLQKYLHNFPGRSVELAN
jgi:hypothetical protein